MRKIKDIAITEPLVDMVESRAVVSNAVPILSLDVLTCKKEVCILYLLFSVQYESLVKVAMCQWQSAMLYCTVLWLCHD